MSTELERRLRAAFDDDARRARMVNPDGPPIAESMPLATDERRRRTVRALVAVAAVVLVLVLISGLAFRAGEQQVDTTPPATEPTTVPTVVTTTSVPPTAASGPAPSTIISQWGCPFGVAGDPVAMQPGAIDGRFDLEAGQGVAHLRLGEQVVEVRVPGFERASDERAPEDGGAWRDETIELARGPARLWLDGPPSGDDEKPFVQVGYFPPTEAPCSSFSVTVDGGTEASNRATAVAFAERIVLPAEHPSLDLPGAEGGPVAGLDLPGNEWAVVAASNGSVAGATMSFTETTMTWDDGCATVSADYVLDRVEGYLLLTNRTSSDPGCTPPTHPEFTLAWPTIRSVLDGGRIPIGLAGDRLHLGDPFGEYVALDRV